MFDGYENHDVAVYGGYVEDQAQLLKSASGGVGAALSRYFVKAGGYVAGVEYGVDFRRAQYCITNDSHELYKFNGSKYVEIDNLPQARREVLELLEKGEKVLFFGLPCAVASLYKMVEGRPENLFTCELVCHGPMQHRYHEEYIDYLERKYGSRLNDFSVRYKKEGWNPFYLRAEFQNGKVYEKNFFETEYQKVFEIIGKNACYHCAFKGNSRIGDIMIGDFWGCQKSDPFYNYSGVSVIFAETEKGNKLLNSISELRLFETTFEKAVEHNALVVNQRVQSAWYEELKTEVDQKGIIRGVHHFVKKQEVNGSIGENFLNKAKLKLKQLCDIFFVVF